MDEQMWTDGKWKPYWRLNEKDGETDCGIVSDNGWSVCRCPRYQTEQQWKADGALLASAKELYEALEAAVAELSSIHGAFGDKTNAGAHSNALKLGRAALAKAGAA